MNITKNENYQLFYLKTAINELLENNNFSKDLSPIKIECDHKNGYNYINKQQIPLTFPKYLINYINTINKEKTRDYNFIGTITAQRNWINKYKNKNSLIENSNYGRDSSKKYTIDKKYYDVLCSSKFTLTPTGDCPWSYRFFEAIMCLSIPILENNSNDLYHKDYFYYYHDSNHIYYPEKALENYNKFINSKHFLSTIPPNTFS